MRRAGLLLMALGLVCLTAAGSLAVRNQAEEARAGAAGTRALAVMEKALSTPDETEAMIGEQVWLGRLTIPSLELELPILSEWSYENLKTAPCHYCGSAGDGDLVLLAHNYRTHFGPIRRLKPGDPVIFEDMAGTVYAYLVTAVEIVDADALEDVTSGAHDLTLITCTYGGKKRVAVFCDAEKSS
ncbi:MAG: sortase [Oscillospiraceae bacterium]|nr:sortase [Oscillospiraceae bacterium]